MKTTNVMANKRNLCKNKWKFLRMASATANFKLNIFVSHFAFYLTGLL